ncbi:ABC transporter ATP-binding protein [Candidatus Bathyarchaeota archaeon]|nr:MAG: ABC transporter ATP-binding protein [Candidatus Bathyarchaeota archaeon]
MTNTPLLRVNDLSTYYYTRKGVVRAVDHVSFEVSTNESLAIVGESGCGKSTVAHTVIRLLPPNAKIVSGSIVFDGKIDLTKVDDDILRKIRFKEISIVFQGSMNMLNPVMRIEDQIAEVILIHEVTTKEEAVRKARDLLETVGIPSSKGKDYPHQLSGGQKQRVCIAMAIALEPKLIIADEPFTALDVMVQAQLIELLKNIRRKIKNSLIFITHDIHVVGELCDKIAIMYAGKIVEYGELKDVVNSPKHPYTVGLLEAVPSIDGPATSLSSIPGLPPNLINPPSGCRFHPRCSKRLELCDKEVPPLVKVNKDHFVACHLVARDRE